MQVIGITGGVGAGKSAILEYLEENYRVKNLEADRIAEKLMEPGTECYDKLLKFLPVNIYNEDETINRSASVFTGENQANVSKPDVRRRIPEPLPGSD